MKTKLVLTQAFFVLTLLLTAQNVSDATQTILVGQLYRYDTIPPLQLEKAKLRIWYEYSHPIEYEKETIIRRYYDTCGRK